MEPNIIFIQYIYYITAQCSSNFGNEGQNESIANRDRIRIRNLSEWAIIPSLKANKYTIFGYVIVVCNNRARNYLFYVDFSF